mmetsp:Transcript_57930/g.66119  ORF Transcript_57930/g.66119 Transcript_57930/m.66119 type:complete len:245 (-) Transcript_57930:715-1449(-)
MGVESSDKHERFVQQLVDIIFSGLNTLDTVLLEGSARITNQSNGVQDITHHQGFEDVEFEMSVGSTNRDSNMVSHNLSANHSQGFTLCGVDFAGHDGRSRFVFGQHQFAETTSRSRSQKSDIIANFHQRNSEGVQSSTELDQSIMSSQGFEFVGGGGELVTSFCGDGFGNGFSESDISVDTSSDSSSSLSQFRQFGQIGLDTFNTVFNLFGISTEFLAQSQGSGILSVSSSDLDDTFELFNLLQ